MHKLLFPPATGQTLCINNEISPVYKVICLRDLEDFPLIFFLSGTEDFFKAARPGCMLNWK